MLKTIGIATAALGLQVAAVSITIVSIAAVNDYLQDASCKYEAKLSNLDNSYCNHRDYETVY